MEDPSADRHDPADTLAAVAERLSLARPGEAAALLAERYPMRRGALRRDHRARSAERAHAPSPRPPTTPARRLALFARDGFVDRRTGRRLVCPPALYAIAHDVPGAFPAGDGPSDSHPGFHELFPTLEHVRGLAAGSMHVESSWVTVSTATSVAGASIGAGPDGRAPFARAPDASEADAPWDGLLGWYVGYALTRPYLAGVRFNRGWHEAALRGRDGGAAASGRAA